MTCDGANEEKKNEEHDGVDAAHVSNEVEQVISAAGVLDL